MDLGSIISGGVGTAMDIWKVGRSSDEAEFSRDWQKQMSNTAYQRATADMKAAGLNPMLAYSQGGASTPSGAVGDVGDVSNPVSSALEFQKAKSEVDLIKAQTAKATADANLTNKTMPPADPWRMFYDFVRETGLFKGAKDTASSFADYVSDTAKTFPLRPQKGVTRQATPAMTPAQRNMLQRKGYYTRPSR